MGHPVYIMYISMHIYTYIDIYKFMQLLLKSLNTMLLRSHEPWSQFNSYFHLFFDIILFMKPQKSIFLSSDLYSNLIYIRLLSPDTMGTVSSTLIYICLSSLASIWHIGSRYENTSFLPNHFGFKYFLNYLSILEKKKWNSR